MLHTVSHTVFSSLAIFFSSIRFSSCNFSLTHCYTHSFLILSNSSHSYFPLFFLFFSFLSFFSFSLSLFLSPLKITRFTWISKNEASSFFVYNFCDISVILAILVFFPLGPDMDLFGLLVPDWRSTRLSPYLNALPTSLALSFSSPALLFLFALSHSRRFAKSRVYV